MSRTQPKVGDAVIFHDSRGVAHHALVTAVWSDNLDPLINVVTVSGDQNREDQYGRQIERATSVMHGSTPGAVHGYYWRRPDEEPNVYRAPAQT